MIFGSCIELVHWIYGPTYNWGHHLADLKRCEAEITHVGSFGHKWYNKQQRNKLPLYFSWVFFLDVDMVSCELWMRTIVAMSLQQVWDCWEMTGNIRINKILHSNSNVLFHPPSWRCHYSIIVFISHVTDASFEHLQSIFQMAILIHQVPSFLHRRRRSKRPRCLGCCCSIHAGTTLCSE